MWHIMLSRLFFFPLQSSINVAFFLQVILSNTVQENGVMFWDERYWLPRGFSWNDLKSNHTVHYPDIWELSYAMKYVFKFC